MTFSLTPEAELKAIIEVQVANDCDYAQIVIKGDRMHLFHPVDADVYYYIGGTLFSMNILDILLNADGLKAYKTNIHYRNNIAHRILDTWLSSNGDPIATIHTAYELLPKP